MADPQWGLKLSGKQGRQALGVFIAKDRVTTLVFPANQSSDSDSLEQENSAAVVRYRHDLGESSTLGVLATSRAGDGYSNRVFGVDGHIRLSKNDTAQFQLLSSQTRYPEQVAADYDQPRGTFEGSALQFFYLHEAGPRTPRPIPPSKRGDTDSAANSAARLETFEQLDVAGASYGSCISST